MTHSFSSEYEHSEHIKVVIFSVLQHSSQSVRYSIVARNGTCCGWKGVSPRRDTKSNSVLEIVSQVVTQYFLKSLSAVSGHHLMFCSTRNRICEPPVASTAHLRRQELAASFLARPWHYIKLLVPNHSFSSPSTSATTTTLLLLSP